jgi:diacylglycerol kinase family enzyme
MANRAHVFVNEGSGAGSCDSAEVTLLFREQGWTCTCTAVSPSLHIRQIAESEPAETVFVAAGGDGTVNAVANAVIRSKRPMGILPVGTLNHFARDLGLPLKLEEAVKAIVNGGIRTVDAGEVNGAIFVNNSSIGVYPMMVLDRERMKKSGLNKWASLVWASTKAFVRFRCLNVELEVDGEVRHHRTPLVFVGNNEYQLEGTHLGARKSLDSGRLAVCLVSDARRVTILRMVFAAFFGRLRSMPEYQEFHVEQFAVTTGRRRLRVSLDGEVRKMKGPLRYRILPRSLTVCAPVPERQ